MYRPVTEMTPKPPIILTTDFGLKDEYVGVMKGVILSIDAGATIIDLTHSIEPQNVPEAARLIGRSYRFFPQGSIHLCIVDPGVGSTRRILVIHADDRFFVGPDNGIFTPILSSGTCSAIHELTNEDWFLDPVSRTFHGRDIMAPAVARLSLGEPVEGAGRAVSQSGCVTIEDPRPIISTSSIDGTIVAIDHFGNLTTTIDDKTLLKSGGNGKWTIGLNNRVIALSARSYADLPDDEPAALINSSGFIEICIKNGNAARTLGARVGDAVRVRPANTQ